MQNKVLKKYIIHFLYLFCGYGQKQVRSGREIYVKRSRIQALEMNYLRSACGVSRMDGASYESVNGRFGMCSKGEGMSYVGVEAVKHSTSLSWSIHLQEPDDTEITRKIYNNRLNNVGVRGQTPVKWKNTVLEYLREKEDMR